MNENEMQFEANKMPVAAQKKSGKKWLVIGAAALAVIAILVAIVIGVMSSSPLGLITIGFRNSMEALESNRTFSMLEKVSTGGSIEYALDLKTLLADSGLAMDGTASIKAYADSVNQKSVLTLGVKLGQLQSLDASLFLSADNMVLSSQALLGDQAYGINLQSFAEDFNKSVFRMDGPYSLGIELPENLQSQMTDSQKFSDDTMQILEKAAVRLAKLFGENSTVEKENATLPLGGEEVKTTAVTVTMDHRQLAAFAAEAIEYLRTNEEIKKYLDENKEYLFQVYGLNGEYNDADALVEYLYRELDTAAAEMEETAKEMEESGFYTAITFHISKSGKQLIGYEQTGQLDGETGELRIYAGPDLAEAKEFLFYMNDNGQISEASYIVKVSDENTFVSLLDLRENGQNVLTTDIRWDKQTGKLEITGAVEQDSSVTVQGTLEVTEEKLTAVLDTIASGSETKALGFTAVLRTSDEMPATPQYADLLKMTEAEVGSLVQELGTVFLQLAYGLM